MGLSLDKINKVIIEIINLRLRIFNFVRIKASRKGNTIILFRKCRMKKNK